MGMHQIERQFTRIGARAKIHPPVVNRWTKVEGVSIDIGNDADGEFFDISVERPVLAETRVLDVQPSLRHLLLMSDQTDGKHKFLCGHDERHWFVAGVPAAGGRGERHQEWPLPSTWRPDDGRERPRPAARLSRAGLTCWSRWTQT